MRVLSLIIIFLALSCSKGPLGGKSAADIGHTPFFEVEPSDINNIPQINSNNIFSIIEDEFLTSTIVGSDLDNDPLEYQIVVQPLNGVVVLDSISGQFTYTPNLGFFGLDFFTVIAKDETSYSADKTFFVSVLKKTDISGSLVVNSITSANVQINFTQLQVDDSADLNICISEDANSNNAIEVSEYCNIAGSTFSVSESGDSSTWSDLDIQSGTNGLTFNIDPCDVKKIFVVAEVVGQNNTQIVTSPLYHRPGWTPACLNASGGLKLWLSSLESSSFTTNYVTTPVISSGTVGSSILTTVTNPTSRVPVGSTIKVGTDEFEVTATSSTTISVTPALTNSIVSEAVKVLTISQWRDLSAAGFNANQSNPSLQPYYTTKGINLLPSVLSDGNKRGLSVSGITYNEFTIFMIIRERNINQAVRAYVTKRTGTYNNQFIFSYDLSANNITWDQAGDTYREDTGFSAQANTTYIYNWTRKSGERRYQYIDGVLNYSSTRNPDQNNSSRLDIGHQDHADLRAINGFIGEFIVLNTYISPENRIRIEGYLAWKWGLQGNLPADHPYKTQSF